jgi:hypothetical protein
MSKHPSIQKILVQCCADFGIRSVGAAYRRPATPSHVHTNFYQIQPLDFI